MNIKMVMSIIFIALSCLISQVALALIEPIEPGNTAAILSSTVSDISSPEAVEAANLGLTVQFVSPEDWVDVDYGAFSTIIFGDNNCSLDITDLVAPEGNTEVWGPQINGPIVLMGTAPSYFILNPNPFDPTVSLAASTLWRNSISRSIGNRDKTGMVASLSCNYSMVEELTHVPVLDAFKSPTGDGFHVYSGNMFGLTGLDEVVVVEPADVMMNNLTNVNMSGWGNSVQAMFKVYNPDFTPVRIALFDGPFSESFGTVNGLPDILVREEVYESNISISTSVTPVEIGIDFEVVATVTDFGTPVLGAGVMFTVIDGPNMGLNDTVYTNSDGVAVFAWTSSDIGVDILEVAYTPEGDAIESEFIHVTWFYVEPLPPLVCDAGSDGNVDENSTYTLDGSGSSGFGELTYDWNGPLSLDDNSIATPSFNAPEVNDTYDTLWELTVSDDGDGGRSAECWVFVIIHDTESTLDCSNASITPYTLWPVSKKKYVEVEVAGVAGDISITSVTCDEKNTKKVAPGAKMTSDGSLLLLPYRDPEGDGRVYGVHFQAKNKVTTCTGYATAAVPHDADKPAVDSGQDYDAFVR